MRVRLLHPDRDEGTDPTPPPLFEDRRKDLGMELIVSVMAGGDAFVGECCEKTMSTLLTDPARIRFRQEILDDCLANEEPIRQLYRSTSAHLAEQRKALGFWFSTRSPATVLNGSVRTIDLLLPFLGELHAAAAALREHARSPGLSRLLDTLVEEMQPRYLDEVRHCLVDLRFPDGVLFSTTLGPGNVTTGHTLHVAPHRGWLQRLAGRSKRELSFVVAERDEAGHRALDDLRSRAVNTAAGAVARAAEDVVAFLHQLRVELAFYIGCMNLHHRLTAVGMPLCRPTPEAAMTSMLDAEDLYDPCLALVTNAPVVPNDLPATGKGLVVITGANQGGKSTLLRALGLAQVMSQCGMLVAARHYRSSVRDQIFTHYKREEDDGLELGKLDEELVRMRRITDHVSPASLVLCNESFASTNESEGSEIGHQILRALTEAGTTVVFVTHLHELALRLWHDEDETRLFLRADRGDQGRRTYRLVAGRPLPTSFGADTFAKVFCETLPRSTR